MANVKISWWQWIPIFRWRIVATVDDADEIPVKLPLRGATLVGTLKQPKWIAFDCPCGKNHRLLINLASSRSPFWRVLNEFPLTLSPSVDFHGKIRCHYFITNGVTVWAKEQY